MKKLLSFLVVATMLLAGCNQTPAEVEQPAEDPAAAVVTSSFEGQYVVDIEYVKANMGNENFLAVDTRGEEAAAGGTLDGAIAVIWQQFAAVSEGKSGDPMWGTVLPADQLSAALSAAGISKDKDIVLFADTAAGWGDDGRILWMLAMAGYDNVKILDGGIAAILNSGLDIAKGATPYTPAEVVVDSIDYKTSIDTDELVAKITENPELKIIDTRNPKEYNGATDFGEAKGGHLPGAINIDFMELLQDGYLKSNDDIVKLLADNGITQDDEIVTYCTAGIRSGYMQKVLEMCGFTNVRNYDESYYRWSAVNEVVK